jgi:hypothetical protein
MRSGAVLLVALLSLSVSACVPPILHVLVPPVFRHDIGAWPDADQVCIALPATQALYVDRSCLSMRAIRRLILTAQTANNEDPR